MIDAKPQRQTKQMNEIICSQEVTANKTNTYSKSEKQKSDVAY